MCVGTVSWNFGGERGAHGAVLFLHTYGAKSRTSHKLLASHRSGNKRATKLIFKLSAASLLLSKGQLPQFYSGCEIVHYRVTWLIDDFNNDLI